MKKRIAFIILMFFTGVINISAEAKNDTAQMYFHKALERYLKGDIEGTIKNAEEALEFDGKNKKIKAFLVKILAEKGSQLFMNKEYREALPYLEKAMRIEPENKKINKMYGIINRQLSGGEYQEPLHREKETVPKSVQERPVMQQPANYGIELEREETMRALLLTVQEQQKELIKAYTYPQDILRQVVIDSDKERKYLLDVLERSLKEKDGRDISTRTVLIGIGGIIAAVVAVILFIYMLMIRMSNRREQFLIQQQARILDVVQQQSLALAQGSTRLRIDSNLLDDKITARQMINDQNPRVRSKGLEVIEAELIEDNEDSEVAERLLEPFIKENDNRVRSTALKILYRYNPQKAIDNIREMLESDNKWMRISAAWVLGEVAPTPEIVDILMTNVNSEDRHLRKRILNSLQCVLRTEKDIDAKTKKHIKDTLRNHNIDVEGDEENL